MNTIQVNGKTYFIPAGSNVSVINNKVFVNGAPFVGEDEPLQGLVELKIVGDCVANISSDVAVSVEGTVVGDIKAGGSVRCGNVGGNVFADGSVQAGDVGGDIRADGSIKCGKVAGNATAGGSILHA